MFVNKTSNERRSNVFRTRVRNVQQTYAESASERTRNVFHQNNADNITTQRIKIFHIDLISVTVLINTEYTRLSVNG